MKKEKIGGIYAIYNKIVKSVYIGKTNCFTKRWKTHTTLLESNHHPNYPLQRDWNAQGDAGFSFQILEVCSDEEAIKKESQWIEKMRKDGYFTYNLMGKYSFFFIYRLKNISLIAPLFGSKESGEWTK